MIGLILSIIVFNLVAFQTNKRLSKNQMIHVWAFTIVLQMAFDGFVDHKYHGYWYFSNEIEFIDVLTVTVLVPPVNIMFLNWFPFQFGAVKKVLYFLVWYIIIVFYEVLALLPEPWGYFHYGWWKLKYSMLIDPILLMILIVYYKWIVKVENEVRSESQSS
ncbi:hypothetical protein Q75_11140 [Bacillus coahuilensis p1.1.43]|uniref:Uncharacterized protein n=2 Tax=Bacillus coahuilensis TaxID=408580 RepID=A0A147K6R8_9BACI|nr:hypothetical protein [Bacillus coahuilensis]KUP05736.1 hypothetical protein Q75_11140 [Bacillus coahuilensis p1.1.43]